MTQSGKEFETAYEPGDFAPFSGVYRCIVCGITTTSILGYPLPAAHVVGAHDEPVRWQLFVKSDLVGGR